MSNPYLELGSQHSISELVEGLSRLDKIKSRQNGNRVTHLPSFLRIAERKARSIGVTRTADISYLSYKRYPVYQTCRPSIFYHTAIGQNTGSQGKGPSAVQAKLSSLMESIEGYCAEPRAPHLIRATHDFLSLHHLVVNPLNLALQNRPERYTSDTPLMWTRAFCVDLDEEVLIPAEMGYFPFFPGDYNTPCLHPCSTNGLASGASYLEAVVHALYEIIERHYTGLFEKGELHVEAIHEEEIPNPSVQSFISLNDSDFELQLYALEMKGLKKNLPMIMALLVSSDQIYDGYGCAGNLDMAIDRAVSEAFQSVATQISGAREDMDGKTHDDGKIFEKSPQPQFRTLRISDYRKRLHDYMFTNLQSEYQMILKFLRVANFGKTHIVNLTRRGIDIPVVKVICENADSPIKNKGGSRFLQKEIFAYNFPNMRDQSNESSQN